jgi:hypothetical protein
LVNDISIACRVSAYIRLMSMAASMKTQFISEVTTAAFTSFDAEVQPYSTEKPAPDVCINSFFREEWHFFFDCCFTHSLECLNADVVQGRRSSTPAHREGSPGDDRR